MGAHKLKLCSHSAMRQNPILCAVSPVSQNLYGQSLNDLFIFLARKYASFEHSVYCRIHYGRLPHLREKYGKSHPQDFVDFHFAATQIFTKCTFLLHIFQHNGNYRMTAFYCYVLCFGILLSWHANDVMFFGCQANFGTQMNYATGTYNNNSDWLVGYP